jgi:hypothetical protein
MTRREHELAVIEAAMEYARMASFGAIFNAIRALDACTEPDLVALNAAVAETDEAHYALAERGGFDLHVTDALITARKARREALKPKVRYCGEGCTVYDRERKTHLTMTEVTALLNAQEKP